MKIKSLFTNRILSLVIALMMIIGTSPITAKAAGNPHLYIANITVIDKSGIQNSNPVENLSVSYDSAANSATITLKGVNTDKHSLSGYGAAIEAYDLSHIYIILEDGSENYFEVSWWGAEYLSFIYATCPVTISGNGSLNVTMNNISGTSYGYDLVSAWGIRCTNGTLTLCDGAKVNLALDLRTYSKCYGVQAGNMMIRNADLSLDVKNKSTQATTACLDGNVSLVVGSLSLKTNQGEIGGTINAPGATKTTENGTTTYKIDPVHITGITLSKSTDQLYVGSSLDILASILPSDATLKELEWSVADKGIVSLAPSSDGTSCIVTGLGPGETTVTAAAKDGSAEKSSCVVAVKYLPTSEIKEGKIFGNDYYRDDVYWFKSGSEAQVMPPDGFMISKTHDGSFGNLVSLSAIDNKSVCLKRGSDGAMTDFIDLSGRLKWDSTSPTGAVRITAGNFWTKLINKISLGMFFKEKQTVSITAEDAESGVKSIQYYYYYEDLINDPSLSSAEAVAKLEAAIGNRWKDYNGPVELRQDGKYVVYAKITDNVGNVSYISSNGFVQYSDTTSATTSLSTTYKAGEDRGISVELNGNTVKEVKRGNAVLAESDYTVSGDKITLKAEFLDTLVAGEYTITISLNPQGVPFVESGTNEKPAEITVGLTVNTRQVAVPTKDTRSFVYHGGEQTYNLASSEWYTVIGNKQTNAGTYTVAVALKDKDNTVWSDGTTDDKAYEFFIAKADQAAPTGFTKTDTTYFGKADGKISGLTSAMEFRKEGGSAYTAGFNGTLEYLAAGTYYIRYPGDANHNPSPDTVVTVNDGRKLQIVVPQNQEGYTVTVNKTEMEYEGSYKLKVEIHEGYTATEDFKIIISNWECGQQAGVEETYMNAIADQIIEVRGVADITPPAAEIKIKENKWNSFLNDLTFGLFLKEEQNVIITADDAGSGVRSVQYYLSDRELELDEVRSITDWIDYNGAFKINPDNKYVVYAKLTDNDGNTAYINSEGIVLDATLPVIEGIENGKTYYTTQSFTVNESNLESVTVNGAPSMTLTLGGNTDKKYVVVATDKAGNITTVTVTMKPIKELAKATENLTHANVTSADLPALRELIEKLNELIADPNTSDDGEKETLEQHKAVAESLIKAIEDAAKAIDTDNTEKVEGVTADNVTPEDKTDLEKAKVDLENALEMSGGNYTADEKRAIEDNIKCIDDALEVIAKVEAVEKLIEKLPETIKKNDESAVKAADDAYNALTDYERKLVDKDAKKALKDAKAALAELREPAEAVSPLTGEGGNVFLWIALLFISGGAGIALTVAERRKKSSAANK